MREIGGRKVIVLDQKLDEDTTVATILVRASTENVANDVERALGRETSFVVINKTFILIIIILIIVYVTKIQTLYMHCNVI